MAWDVDKILRNKKQERQNLEAQDTADDDPRLKALRQQIPVLEAALEVLKDTRRRESPRRGTVSDVSHVGIARDILNSAKKPMHVDDIVRQMEGLGYKARKAALTSRLSKMVRARNLFEQVAPGTFGLIEWHKSGYPLTPRVERRKWDEQERARANVRYLKQNRRP